MTGKRRDCEVLINAHDARPAAMTAPSVQRTRHAADEDECACGIRRIRGCARSSYVKRTDLRARQIICMALTVAAKPKTQVIMSAERTSTAS